MLPLPAVLATVQFFIQTGSQVLPSSRRPLVGLRVPGQQTPRVAIYLVRNEVKSSEVNAIDFFAPFANTKTAKLEFVHRIFVSQKNPTPARFTRNTSDQTMAKTPSKGITGEWNVIICSQDYMDKTSTSVMGLRAKLVCFLTFHETLDVDYAFVFQEYTLDQEPPESDRQVWRTQLG
ncbi:hypothetical protein V5O48_009430 [Marasmius crinis-equi]|uniref:Uncharacterized protein n=1 Tax=Marasmius crinis-equi TaxID=585013 RepID=A0ABR3FB46_9AGAR